MTEKTARVLITLDCHNDCSYCCNKHRNTLMKLTPIGLEFLLGYETVVLTGGEPLLEYEKTLQVAQILSMRVTKVYLYTSTSSSKFNPILSFLEGITLSVHYSSAMREASLLSLNSGFKNKRLWISPECGEVNIVPSHWEKISFGETYEDGDCNWPEDDLFILV